MAWEGRFLVIGFASGTIPQIPLNLPLLKGCDIRGVIYGVSARRDPDQNRTNMARLFEAWRAGELRPNVAEVFPLSDAPRALRRLAERGAAGKLVVDCRN